MSSQQVCTLKIRVGYDWDKPLLPGTVVCSKYGAFDGGERIGVFLVLYDEQSDAQLSDDKNVIAVKISTKNTCVSNYSIPIDRKLNNFLDDDCIVCCSKLHTLHKKQQIYKVLGQLHPITFKKVFQTYTQFSSNVQNQLIMNL